jgi:radical SAM-linked protein
MRYTGHMDLHRTLERTLRRAMLPVSHTQGFTRRARINLAAALPLGVTSECELADIWFDEELPLDELKDRIAASQPPGMQIRSIETVPMDAPKLPAQIGAADYTILFRDSAPGLETAITALLAAPALPRERRGKPYDLRTLILDAGALEPDAEGSARMWVRLLAQEGATGRCDEIVAALELNPLATLAHRTALYLKSDPHIFPQNGQSD